MGFMDQLKHGWNAFTDNKSKDERTYSYGTGANFSPSMNRYRATGDRSILSSIYNRISIDVAAISLQHIRRDDKGRFAEVVKSGLNNCLTLEANLDQGARHFRQSMVYEMFTNGAIAIVPVETTGDPILSGSYDIQQLRVGIITEWLPQHVRVSVYDQRDGARKTITVPKRLVAIVENPFYAVMNEPNGTLSRLIRKLSLLDQVDEQASTGKLDMIIQLPYTIRTDTRRDQANKRRRDLEDQLKDSKLGIGYLDAAEKVTQLNRPIENNMLKQIEFLTDQLYSQLGISSAIFDGTATPVQKLDYYNRTIEPILTALQEAMARTFLTRTARTQGQAIAFYQDPFRLMPIDQVAEVGDKMIRNMIMSKNEFRDKLGLPPSDDPEADKLSNPNLYDASGSPTVAPVSEDQAVNDVQ